MQSTSNIHLILHEFNCNLGQKRHRPINCSRATLHKYKNKAFILLVCLSSTTDKNIKEYPEARHKLQLKYLLVFRTLISDCENISRNQNPNDVAWFSNGFLICISYHDYVDQYRYSNAITNAEPDIAKVNHLYLRRRRFNFRSILFQF